MKIPLNATIVISICLWSSLTNLAQAQPVIDCSKKSPKDTVVTSLGVEPASKYCDFEEKLPQVMTNTNVVSQPSPKPRGRFGKPYNAKDSVCRDRGIDTICLTPRNSNKLNELK